VDDAVVDSYWLCYANDTNGWIRRTVDLRSFAGRSVVIKFKAVCDGSLNSNLFIDNVAFQSSSSIMGSFSGEIPISISTTLKESILGK
jgi:hypothetical protein